jgi:hypothetical protein
MTLIESREGAMGEAEQQQVLVAEVIPEQVLNGA